ncbi:MAG: NosD domain-containing protein, partial [Methanobacteriaceae archaeon]
NGQATNIFQTGYITAQTQAYAQVGNTGQIVYANLHIWGDIFVNPLTGNDVNNGYRLGTAKQHIQAAVDMARDGERVVLASGTYIENVIISHPVTIRPMIEGNIVIINPADVNVPDFTINGAGSRTIIQGLHINGATSSSGVKLENANDVFITGNDISGNYNGVHVDNSNATIQFNRLVGNSHTGLYLTGENNVDATLNWWGSNDPAVADNLITNEGFGTLNSDPCITLRITSENDPVSPGGRTYLNAYLAYDSNGMFHYPYYGHFPDGVEIFFDPGTMGTLESNRGFTNFGGVTTRFLAGPNEGYDTINANLDGFTDDDQLEIRQVYYYVDIINGHDYWDGLSDTYLGGSTGPKQHIQAAIEDATDGAEIIVAEGNYSENIIINKFIKLLANGMVNIYGPEGVYNDGGGGITYYPLIYIGEYGSYSTINGFNLYCYYSEQYNNVIYLDWAYGCTISNNHIINEYGNGIYLLNSNDNTIFGNNIASSNAGIYLEGSSGNIIYENNIHDSGHGIQLDSSPNNGIYRNVISHDHEGIEVNYSENVIINENVISNNFGYGIDVNNDSTVEIHFNVITGNDCGLSVDDSSAVNATLNWWGSNDEPSIDYNNGIVYYSPWLVFTATVDPNHVDPDETFTISADLNHDSDSILHDPAYGHLPDGIEVGIYDYFHDMYDWPEITDGAISAIITAESLPGRYYFDVSFYDASTTFYVRVGPPVFDVYVDVINGYDTNDGLTEGTAVSTISHALDLVDIGGTVHIAEGNYSENIYINYMVNLVPYIGANVTIQPANINQTIITINNGGSGSSIQGLTITGSINGNGIYLYNAQNCTITGNTIIDNVWGVYLYYSINNTISGNNITSNGDGIDIESSSSYNTVSGNNITLNTWYGISISYSANNTLISNILSNNDNLHVYGSVEDCVQNIYDPINHPLDNSTWNYIKGNPVYYMIGDTSGLVIDGNDSLYSTGIGYLGLILCSNVTVRNVSIANGELLLAGTNDSSIENGSVSVIDLLSSNNNCVSGMNLCDSWGIYLENSSNNTISGNNINNSHYYGISLDVSYNNTISGNTITNCTYNGIELWDSSNNNTISGNNISSNYNGIYSGYAYYNTISGNNITDNNNDGVHIEYSEENTFTQNDVSGNERNGIYVYYAIYNVIYENILIRNDNDGIYIESSSGNQIIDNNITENDFGIVLYNSNDTNITSNIIKGNYIGIKAEDSQAEIHFNIIWVNEYLDMHVLGSSNINATLNWWGTNYGPSSSMINGTLIYDPWLVLTVTADPSSILPTGFSTITADLTHDSTYDSSNPDVSKHDPVSGHVPDSDVLFTNITLGTVSYTNRRLINGINSTVFTSNGTIGTATINMTLDGYSKSVQVTVVSARNNVFNWTTETINNSFELSDFDQTSLVVDSSDNPHVIYCDSEYSDLKYAYKDALGWHTEFIDVASYNPSLKLDSNGNPHVLYEYWNGYYLKYAYRTTPNTWVIETIYNFSYPGYYNSLILDSSNNPYMSFYDSTNHLLMFAYRTAPDTWITEIVDNSSGNVGGYNSIGLIGSTPVISYYDWVNRCLKYAYRTGPNAWTTETVDSTGNVGQYSSLVVDSIGIPIISYYDVTNGDLKFAYRTGPNTWIAETVDSTGDVGQYTSLALYQNNPRISYYDVTNGDLKFASKDGSNSWNTVTVDNSTDDVGLWTALALNVFGDPRISYIDNTDLTLKYAYQRLVHDITSGNVFNTIQEAVNDPSTFNGDVLELDSGLYIENVLLEKLLTIKPINGAIAIIQTLNSTNTVFTINSGGSGSTIQGLTITGANDGIGIDINGANNCNISNNIVINNLRGIVLGFSDNNTISGNSLINNTYSGIYLYSSTNNTISGNNQIIGNGNDYGIELDSSSGNIISGNNQIEGNYCGIALYNSLNNNTISGNDITNNKQYGIYLYNSNINRISGNNIAENNYGIYLFASDNNKISGNNITNSTGNGISLEGSSINTISGNNITNNNFGIYDVWSSNNNIISGNNIINNKWYGIYLWGSSDNHIDDTYGNNQITSNNVGIFIGSSDNNTISGNNITNNLNGIYLYSSSGNNTISGNNIIDNINIGIILSDSPNNTLASNILGNNGYNLFIEGSSVLDFMENIYTSNTVDGKPVYYYTPDNQPSGTIIDGSGMGYLGIVSLTGIKVQNLNITHEGQGLLLVNDTGFVVESCTFQNNNYGVYIFNSSAIINFNRILDNTGLYVTNSSTVNATLNWWGSNEYYYVNSKIYHDGTGSVIYGPWMKLTVTASPNIVSVGGNSTIIADLIHDSNNVVHNEGYVPYDMNNVNFTATLGSITDYSVGPGSVTKIFTAGSTQKPASINATVDGYTIPVQVNIGTLSVHDINSTQGFTSIQDAIDAANPGDIIEIDSGTFNETINIYKKLTLRPSSGATVIIQPIGSNYVVNIWESYASGTTIMGLKLINAGDGCSGINIWRANDCIITGNELYGNDYGIIVHESSNATISGNNIHDNRQNGIYLIEASENHIDDSVAPNQIYNNAWYGILIRFAESNHNVIYGNNIYGNIVGIEFWDSASSNTISGNNITLNTNSGIYLESLNNNNIISGNQITGNSYGIYLDQYSNNNTISGNIILNNHDGIYLAYSSGNTINGNDQITGNYNGICLDYYSNNNIISGNTLSSNANNGIGLLYSPNNTLTDNVLENNTYNLNIQGNGVSDYVETIGQSNTVDGKPVCYYTNLPQGSVIDGSGIGYLGLINCSGITVKNLNIVHNGQGILLAGTSNSNIVNSTFMNNYDGIDLYYSSDNNTISGNNVKSNMGVGIHLVLSLENHIDDSITPNKISNNTFGIYIFNFGSLDLSNFISGNNISSNSYGIDLWYSDNTVISGNNITNNDEGIELHLSNDNIISGNNIENNRIGVYIEDSSVLIQFNRIYNNIDYNVCRTGSGTVDARYNWWGSNSGPSNIFGLISSEYDPWMILTLNATSETVNPGTSTTIIADLTHDSTYLTDHNAPGHDPASGHVPDADVLFTNITLGSVNYTTRRLINGSNSTIFTSNGTSGIGNVSAQL